MVKIAQLGAMLRRIAKLLGGSSLLLLAGRSFRFLMDDVVERHCWPGMKSMSITLVFVSLKDSAL